MSVQSSDQHTPDPREGQGDNRPLVTRARWVTTVSRPVRFVAGGARLFDLIDGTAEHVYVCGQPPTQREIVAAIAGGDARVYLGDGRYPALRIGQSRVTWAGQWFTDRATPAEAETVWEWLRGQIRDAWDERADLLLTPSTTGRDLWLRTVRSEGYPVLSTEAQDLIRNTSGQGRIETMRGAGGGIAHLYDARLAYLACLRNLPVGEPELHQGDARADQYSPCRLEVSWRAPADWGWRPGILPTKGGEGGGWSWPPAGRGWVDGAELLVAERHGWAITVHQTLLYPGRADVFRTWMDRLRVVMGAGGLEYSGSGAVRLAQFARFAVRAIALHTVGAFHGQPGKETGIGPSEAIPAGAKSTRMVGADRWAWEAPRPQKWPQMSHPEWTAAIWARARARLLDTAGAGALHIPPGHVIGFRTDAILTSHPVPFPDTGRVGEYRHQGSAPFDRWPRSNNETAALKKACEVHNDQLGRG